MSLFKLPPLTYSFNSLGNCIDSKTMEIHYTKHHQGYVNKLNQALIKEENNKIFEKIKINETPPEEQKLGNAKIEKEIHNLHVIDYNLARCRKLLDLGSNSELLKKSSIRNNLGGHYNHSLFWTMITPGKSTTIPLLLKDVLEKRFGSIESFKTQFKKEALDLFGSGWVWLQLNKEVLFIQSTPNQDNPIMSFYGENKATPLLGLDLWEHAYYLRYQNNRGKYIDAFWDIVNWERVAQNYQKAITTYA